MPTTKTINFTQEDYNYVLSKTRLFDGIWRYITRSRLRRMFRSDPENCKGEIKTNFIFGGYQVNWLNGVGRRLRIGCRVFTPAQTAIIRKWALATPRAARSKKSRRKK